MNPDTNGLYPYQKKFLGYMSKTHAMMEACLTSGAVPFPNTHGKVDHALVFDAMTNDGWKLDLISGIYYKP